jgi:hypothetical protein
MDPTTVFLVCLVVFCATFTRSSLGFGDGLIAMPLLSLIIGIKTATPLVGFIAPTIAFTILGSAWRQVNLMAAWRLILSALAGIPLGLWVLTNLPETLVKMVLGGVLALFSAYNLLSPRLPRLPSENYAFGFGFVAGILGGAYNINGPPAVIYGSLREWPPGQFRATLQAFFLPTGFMIMMGHGLAGLWTWQVVQYYLVVLPLIFGAIWLGHKMNRRIPVARFAKLVYLFLFIIGLTLLA